MLLVSASRRIGSRKLGNTAGVDGLMRLVEKGDRKTAKLFREAVEECLEGIRETLACLNTRHDRFVWESDFIRNGDTERVLARLMRLHECHQDGRLWLDLSAANYEKEYVLRRSDGTTVYAARDLAYHIWKAIIRRIVDVRFGS
jgi:arginyl-tRNA synthetase